MNETIKTLVADLKKLESEKKEIKLDIKNQEKIDSPEYHDLMKALKNLKKQVKDFKDEWIQELRGEETYTKLLEMKLKIDEEIAECNANLHTEMAKLAEAKGVVADANVDTVSGPVRVQVNSELRLYLNGKQN